MAMIDRIKHDASFTNDLLVWKYQAESGKSEEIRMGAQLIVNQSQEALFVKGGQALDLFGPGTYTLSTSNIPLLSKLINLPFGGKTPFAAEVWFINKTAVRDLKWGTQTPIPLMDPVYNYPVSVRAFGTWGLRIEDSRSFVAQLVGTLKSTDTGIIQNYFIGEIIQKLSDTLSRFFTEQKVSIFQANAKLNELSRVTTDSMRKEFARFGIEIVNFNVASINIPEEEKKKFQDILGKRMEIDQISQARVGQAYTAMRTFDTLEKVAENEGGKSSEILINLVGPKQGASIGQQLGQQMNVQPEGQPAADPMVKLQKLKQMLDAGLITQADFDAKKKSILESM